MAGSTSHLGRCSQNPFPAYLMGMKQRKKELHGPATKAYFSIILSTLSLFSQIPLRGSPVFEPVLSVSVLQPAFPPFAQALVNRRNAIGPVGRLIPCNPPRFFGGHVAQIQEAPLPAADDDEALDESARVRHLLDRKVAMIKAVRASS